MKALALDDEPLAIQLISSFCKKTNLIETLTTFTSSEKAGLYLQEEAVDVLFLDINMPAVNGLQFYQSLSVKPLLILTTSYSEFALEGYELAAVDYLLKPFSYERFLKAVEKANHQVELRKFELNTSPLLAVKADAGMAQIAIHDIVYIEGLDNYIKLHLVDGSFVLSRTTLKSILDEVGRYDFFRIHKSYIVPKTKITHIGTKMVKLGSIELPFGKSYESELKSILK